MLTVTFSGENEKKKICSALNSLLKSSSQKHSDYDKKCIVCIYSLIIPEYCC